MAPRRRLGWIRAAGWVLLVLAPALVGLAVICLLDVIASRSLDWLGPVATIAGLASLAGGTTLVRYAAKARREHEAWMWSKGQELGLVPPAPPRIGDIGQPQTWVLPLVRLPELHLLLAKEVMATGVESGTATDQMWMGLTASCAVCGHTFDGKEIGAAVLQSAGGPSFFVHPEHGHSNITAILVGSCPACGKIYAQADARWEPPTQQWASPPMTPAPLSTDPVPEAAAPNHDSARDGTTCVVLKQVPEPTNLPDYVGRVATGFPTHLADCPLAFYTAPKDPRGHGPAYFGMFVATCLRLDGVEPDLSTLQHAFHQDPEGEATLLWMKANVPSALLAEAPTPRVVMERLAASGGGPAGTSGS